MPYPITPIHQHSIVRIISIHPHIHPPSAIQNSFRNKNPNYPKSSVSESTANCRRHKSAARGCDHERDETSERRTSLPHSTPSRLTICSHIPCHPLSPNNLPRLIQPLSIFRFLSITHPTHPTPPPHTSFYLPSPSYSTSTPIPIIPIIPIIPPIHHIRRTHSQRALDHDDGGGVSVLASGYIHGESGGVSTVAEKGEKIRVESGFLIIVVVVFVLVHSII